MATPQFFLNWHMLCIPLTSKPAAREVKMSFTNLHGKCAERGVPAKLKQAKTCSACEAVVGDGEIVKAYFTDKERFVIMTPDELEALESEKDKRMDVVGFVPAGDVDPIYFGPSNYLGPADVPAGHAFALLREAMVKTGRSALVRYVGSGRDKIGLVRVIDDGLILHDLFLAHEVREYRMQIRVPLQPVALSAAEMKAALQLMELGAMAFDMAPYADGYETRVNVLVQARLAGKPVPQLPVRAAAPVVDLMAALQKSLEAKRGAKAEPKDAKLKKGKKAA